jgi:hypothetical protein
MQTGCAVLMLARSKDTNHSRNYAEVEKDILAGTSPGHRFLPVRPGVPPRALRRHRRGAATAIRLMVSGCFGQ